MNQLYLLFFFLVCFYQSFAQTTYLPLHQEDYPLFDRLEAMSGRLSDDIFTSVKPYSRKNAVTFLEKIQGMGDSIRLSKIDQYNLTHTLSVSGEWSANEALDSRRPWFKTFYKKQPDFIHVNTDNFFLSVNPVIAYTGFAENTNTDNSTGFNTSRGVELRSRIVNRIGVYTYFTDNQEKPPSFVQQWMNRHDAVPGADYYLEPKPGVKDYLQAMGYIDFAAIKNHVNVTFGYDRQFYGDGMRSLFLSDFSANALFLRLNTRIWKLNYQNLYLELTPQYTRGGDRRLPRKYATIHHLSTNLTHWLNVGLFEAVVFSRTDRYDWKYAIPVIFYRQIERANGSADNALLGINFKAIALKHLQIYGQFLLDEFRFSELTGNNKWWGNKFGVQVGGKYFDAFGLKNLDLQGEINIVRPFTYSHTDTVANYTHYNQPLAHPLEAGFGEVLGLIRYQPMSRLSLTVKGMYYIKGIDTGSVNNGNDIFMPNGTRSGEFGYPLISGIKSKTASLNIQASYEIWESLYLDLGLTHRQRKYESVLNAESSTYFYGGLRLNIARRNYDFY